MSRTLFDDHRLAPAHGGGGRAQIERTRTCPALRLVSPFVARELFADVGAEEPMETKNPVPSRFGAGQRWKYQTRAGEEASTLLIVKVDVHAKLGNIVHVIVDGLRMRNPGALSGISERFSHLPFSEDAIARSVTDLVGTEDVGADWQEGYSAWQDGFRNGKAGIFSISVSDAVSVLGDALAAD
jgi:hypothetical protein